MVADQAVAAFIRQPVLDRPVVAHDEAEVADPGEQLRVQGRWAEDAQALEGARAELASARAEAIKERERREQAEADALRAGVRLETLEQLLAQLKPDQTAADTTSGGKRRGRG